MVEIIFYESYLFAFGANTINHRQSQSQVLI